MMTVCAFVAFVLAMFVDGSGGTLGLPMGLSMFIASTNSLLGTAAAVYVIVRIDSVIWKALALLTVLLHLALILIPIFNEVGRLWLR
jgi:hypothetical protein